MTYWLLGAAVGLTLARQFAVDTTNALGALCLILAVVIGAAQ